MGQWHPHPELSLWADVCFFGGVSFPSISSAPAFFISAMVDTLSPLIYVVDRANIVPVSKDIPWKCTSSAASRYSKGTAPMQDIFEMLGVGRYGNFSWSVWAKRLKDDTRNKICFANEHDGGPQDNTLKRYASLKASLLGWNPLCSREAWCLTRTSNKGPALTRALIWIRRGISCGNDCEWCHVGQ